MAGGFRSLLAFWIGGAANDPIAQPVETRALGGDDVWPEELRRDERKRRKDQQKTQRDRRAELEALYARITGEATQDEAQEVVAIIEPFVATDTNESVPTASQIDWSELTHKRAIAAELTRVLEALDRLQKTRLRDEEDLMIMLAV